MQSLRDARSHSYLIPSDNYGTFQKVLLDSNIPSMKELYKKNDSSPASIDSLLYHSASLRNRAADNYRVSGISDDYKVSNLKLPDYKP